MKTSARRQRALQAVPLTLLLLLGTAASGRPVHASASDTQVTGAGLTASTTSLSGTGLAVLTISVHLTDPVGVETGSGAIGDDVLLSACPCALLTDSPDVSQDGGLGTRAVELGRVSGSGTDGVWAGTVTVGAVERGTWSLTGVIAGTYREPLANGPEWKAVDGAGLGAVLALTGAHWPRLSIAAITPVPYGSRYVVRGRLTYADTGAGVPYTAVQVQALAGQGPFPDAVLSTTTSADGYWAATAYTPAYQERAFFDADDAERGAWQLYQWSATATRQGRTQHWLVSLSTHVAGSWKYLDVVLTPRQLTTVQLQRNVGGSWQPVVSRTTSSSGTARFATQRSGCYRVRAQANTLMAPYTSRVACV